MMTIQPPLAEDAPAVAAMREAASAHKGEKLAPEARPMFDTMFAATPAAANVRIETATVGGIAGFWLRPATSTSGARLLYLHGGGYVLGSAQAATNFAGQIAARVGVDALSRTIGLRPSILFRPRSTMRLPSIAVSSRTDPNVWRSQAIRRATV
jgi:acetyl esterase/lipase